eukprot:COSAG06_NODE_1837_length_8255_cov_5.426680_2_plen_300_part_00
MASNDVTKQQSELIDKALEDAAAAEAKCEKLEAENERLKNKYEPANGVIVDEYLKLTDGEDESLMHIRVFTGEKMSMVLVPRANLFGGQVWVFGGDQDEIDEKVEQPFWGYGIYEFDVSPCAGHSYRHDCIVRFDANSVQVTAKIQENELQHQLVIEKYTPPPPVVLTVPDPGLETLYEVELLGTTLITFMNAIIINKQLILEFVQKPGGGDGWYFMQDGEGSRRKVFNGYGKHEVKFHWQLKTKVCLVDFKPGTVRILERILGPGAEATLAIRRPEMQQLVDIDEHDVPTGKRARTGQ